MSDAPDKALTDVADRIKSEAATASRAGQMATLDRLADDVQEGAYRLAAVTARAEAAEAKVARIEALVSDYAGAIAVPAWATEYTRGVVDAAQLAHDDLRAALADEGDTDE